VTAVDATDAAPNRASGPIHPSRTDVVVTSSPNQARLGGSLEPAVRLLRAPG
jgi:hypothetical protein